MLPTLQFSRKFGIVFSELADFAEDWRVACF